MPEGVEPSGGDALPRRVPAQRAPERTPIPGVAKGEPGTTIGERYALRTAIGHGGMGTVWRATDTVLRREVAVKEVLLPRGVADGDRDALYQRTLREARAAAALSHPSVVQVYDVVTDGGRPWIVMELLEARSLAEIIVEDGPLAPRAVAKVGVAMLGALEVAHAAGVLHRDVKPANVLICGDGRCVLTDFGVARLPTDSGLTTPGMVLGSPHFISPERAIGASFGPPSDLFSLGVTLYTAVEGRPPFDKPDPFDTMRAVVEDPPAPVVRAGALTSVLYGLLEKDPARRWHIEAARGVLRDLLSGALASKAPPAMETDPYAVFRTAPHVPPTAPQTTKQIGGRAMLAPGETISGAVRRIGSPPTPAQRRPSEDGLAATGAHPMSPSAAPVSPPGAPAVYQGGTAVFHGGAAAFPGGAAPTPGGGAVYSGGAPAFAPDAPMPYRAGALAIPAQRDGGVRPGRHAAHRRPSARQGVLRKLRDAPRRIKLMVAAAAAVTIGVVTVVSLTTGDSSAETPQPQAAVTTDGGLIDMQEYRDAARGFAVNVPKAWTRSASASYVEFVDPADKTRWLRLNVETAAGDAKAFLQVAEKGLKEPGRCATPYNQLGLRDVQLAGKAGSELEYTCGQGASLRHGIWRATVSGGKAYHFYLTVPDNRFQESKTVYDEMARSFRFVSS